MSESPTLHLAAEDGKPPKSKRGRQPRGAGEDKPFDAGTFAHLIENFVLIYGTDTVWDARQRLIMKISAMAHAYGSDLVRAWKASPRRRTVLQQNVVFDPTQSCDLEHCVNLFNGLQIEPRRGDVGPIFALLVHLTSRVSDDEKECAGVLHWLICWLAWPLQHPGTKLRTAVVMHGDEGAGKNFLTDTMCRIYGEYGATVGQDELEDKFNDWRSRKLFVVGDEVSSRTELVHNKNRLKALITSTTVQINPKGLPRREEANHINVMFLSNELQPLALDNSDRRYLVIYTPPALVGEFYEQLGRWREDGGTEALYDYLLRYNTAGFSPYAPAPQTRAKADLIDINRKSPERYWLEWSADELELPYRTCSVDQAYRAYIKYAQRTGDRFPAQKALFSRMLCRIAETNGRPVHVRSMWVGGRTVRMLCVIPPPVGEALGPWATTAHAAFETDLRGYLHGPRSPDGDGYGEPT